MEYSKKLKGEIAELAVAARLLEEGWKVLFPYGEDCRYDIVAEKNKKFIRFQVKYVTPKNGTLTANCRSSNNWSILHYSAEEMDVLAVYDSFSKNIYFIPASEMNRSSFKLRLQDSKNNQKLKTHLADQYNVLVTEM